MKWRWPYIVALLTAGLLASCTNSERSGSTLVTVTIGGGKAAGTSATRSSVLSKTTPTVTSVTFTVTGPGMDPVTRTVQVTPPRTVTEVFYLLNGTGRVFLVEARDGSSALIYSGSTTLDLDGTPVSLTLPLQNMLINRLMRSSGIDEAKAVFRDGNGDIVVAGLTYGGLPYGDIPGSNPNADPTLSTYDIFVSKLSSTGGLRWTRQYGTDTDDDAFGVAADPGGNILITGATNSNLQGQALAGSTDAYVTKLTSTGLHVWTRLTGTAGATTAGNAIAVDAAGNAYITGYTTGGLNGNVSAGSFDVFVTRFSSTGLQEWTVQQGTALEDSGNGIALNAAGTNVYVTGHTYGDLGAAHLGPNTTTDVFVMLIDAATGVWQWTRQLGTVDNDDAKAIAVDAGGNLYVAGGTQGAFGGPNLGQYDMFLLKLDPAGNPAWLNPQLLGSSGIDFANAVTVDASGNVIVTGSSSGAFDGIEGDGLNDLFLVKSDPTGSTPTKLWSREFGTRADDHGIGVVTDPTGTITVVGNTFGSQTSSSTEDVFLLQYDGSGASIP